MTARDCDTASQAGIQKMDKSNFFAKPSSMSNEECIGFSNAHCAFCLESLIVAARFIRPHNADESAGYKNTTIPLRCFMLVVARFIGPNAGTLS
jgi:hypothetical protein